MTDKPKYDADVVKLKDSILEAINHIGNGSEGSVARASVSLGQALERVLALRNAMWSDFDAATNA